jgi:hypothetical protein
VDETDDIGAAIQAAAASVRVPASLRERVADERRSSARRRRRRTGLVGGALAVAAATAAALVLALPDGGGPTVTEAAQAALAAPTAPAPAAVPGTRLLGASVDDVSFPNWEVALGWRAVGQRSGRVDGRPARTVVYQDRAGRRIGYTIVGGDALDVPDGTLRRVAGTAVTVLDRDGVTIATWRQRGHTCVLAAKDVGADTLVGLAAAPIY